MQWLWEILRSEDFWKIAFPALAAIVAWYVNGRSKLTRSSPQPSLSL